MTTALITLGQALLGGIPKIIEAIKAGKNPEDIKLSDVISNDAVETVKRAIGKAESFEDKFEDKD